MSGGESDLQASCRVARPSRMGTARCGPARWTHRLPVQRSLYSALLLIAACSAREAERAPAVVQSEERHFVLEPAPAVPVVVPPEKRVVLVTLDGVRWQDVVAPNAEVDLLPRIYEGVAEGGVVVGASTSPGCAALRATSGSNVSLPGYLEILTGRPTACTHNYCPPTSSPTVLDVAADHGVSGIASFGSWETLGRAVSNGRSLGLFVSAGQGKEKVDPFPGPAGGHYRPDRYTGKAAVAYFRERQPRLLHVGLGDTDEHGHRADLRGYFDALKEADAIVGELMDAVEEAGVASSTTFLVTTDHGRAANFRDHGPGIPAAARSFVIAFGGGVQPAGIACAKQEHTLADVGATMRALLDLPADPSPHAGKPIEEVVAHVAH